MPKEDKEMSIQEYFRKYSRSDAHNIDRDIHSVLEAVNFIPSIPVGSIQTKEQVFAMFLDRTVSSFSG